MTQLPPENWDADTVHLRNRARHEVLKLFPFDVAIQHPLIGAGGKVFIHVRRSMIKLLTVDHQPALNIDPLVSLFHGRIRQAGRR